MSANLVTGSAGEVTGRLLEHLRQRGAADPWAPLRVVVPDARAAEILTLRVAEAGGAFQLAPLTLRALAETLQPAGAARPLSAGARLALMQAACRRELGEAGAGLALAATLVRARDRLVDTGVALPDVEDLLPAPVARVLRAFDRLGEGRPHPQAALAAAVAALGGSGAELGHLDLWGFLDLSPVAAALVTALRARSDLHAFVALPVPGMAVPAGRRRLWRALGTAAADPRCDGAPRTVTVHGLPNAGAEADAAARLAAAWADEGVAPHRIAIVGTTVHLARAGARLAALGLAVRGVATPLAATPAGAAIAALLAVWAHDRVDLLRALVSGPGDPDLAEAAIALADRLGTLPGATARTRLAAFAAAPGGGKGQDDPAGDMAALVRLELERLDGAGSWAELAQALGEAADDLLGVAPDDDDLRGAVADAIARLAEIDALAAVGPPSAELAEACARLELGAPAPPPQVAVAPVDLLGFAHAALAGVDGVVLAGLAAEDVGAAGDATSPFGDETVTRLAARGIELDGAAEDALMRAYAAGIAQAATARTAIVYTAQGRTGARPVAPWLEEAPRGEAPSAPLDALDLRRRLIHGRRIDAAGLAALATDGGALSAPALARLAALATTPTAYDGVLAPPLPAEPRDGWSPSLLEAYGRCPRTDFLGRVLGVGESADDDPLDDAEPDPQAVGEIAHRALEILRRRARGERREPLSHDDVPWVREVLAQALAEAFSARAPTPLGPVHERILLAELTRAALVDAADGDLATLDSEWRFGPEAGAPLRLELPDGRPMLVRGRVDRVAEGSGPGAGVWVVDYKTGAHLPDPEPAPDALQLPLYMLAVSRTWNRPLATVSGRYQSVTSRGRFERRDLDGARLAAQVDRVLDVVGAIRAGMEAGRFSPRPDRGRHCARCRLRPVCPEDIVARAARKGTDVAVGDGRGGASGG